jgi:hypothetical protein
MGSQPLNSLESALAACRRTEVAIPSENRLPLRLEVERSWLLADSKPRAVGQFAQPDKLIYYLFCVSRVPGANRRIEMVNLALFVRLGIFDAFPDESGRQAHLSGRVAAALMEKASELLAQLPTVEKVDVLAR